VSNLFSLQTYASTKELHILKDRDGMMAVTWNVSVTMLTMVTTDVRRSKPYLRISPVVYTVW